MSRILLADDDAEQLTLQKTLLETFGHEVSTALSCPQTLVQLTEFQPDIVVMDLRFPRSADGLALIRNIRGSGCTLPVIVRSGWPDDIYETPEEKMVSRVLIKGGIRELVATIAELVVGQ